MQKVLMTLLATVALASAGGQTGFATSQYTQHSHAVVAHAVQPVVAVRHVAPVAVHHAPIAVHHTVPVVQQVHVPTYYKAAVIPTAYASSYSYRAPPAKVLKTVVQHQPIVYANPQPIYAAKTIVPTAYASSFNYRAPAALVRHHVQPVVAVRHVQPIVAVRHVTPVVHHAPIAVHHAVAPIAVHHTVASHQVVLH